MGCHLVLLGYGQIGDLIAIDRNRRALPKPKAAIAPKDLRRFEAYARMLAGRYPFRGSGADENDVEQVALIAAWDAIEKWQPDRSGDGKLVAFVQQRMRWRVIEFVRDRHGTRLPDRRRVSYEDDLGPYAELDGSVAA